MEAKPISHITAQDVADVFALEFRMELVSNSFKRIIMIVMEDELSYDVEQLELGEWDVITSCYTFEDAATVYNAINTVAVSA